MSDTSAVKSSIEELSETFKKTMAQFQKDLDNAGSTNPTVAAVSSKFDFFKDFVIKSLDALQKQVELVTRQVDHIETRSRRKMLLVHGIDESDSEDTTNLAVNKLQAVLEDLSTADIERSHRLGGRGGHGKKPRAILVKFKDIAIRDDVWFGKVALKGSGVTLGEFLTKPRHNAFMEARERFGVRNCWTWNGDVLVLGKDGVRRRANSVADVKALPVAQATPADAVAEPADAVAEPAAAAASVPKTRPAPQAAQARQQRAKREMVKSKTRL